MADRCNAARYTPEQVATWAQAHHDTDAAGLIVDACGVTDVPTILVAFGYMLAELQLAEPPDQRGNTMAALDVIVRRSNAALRRHGETAGSA